LLDLLVSPPLAGCRKRLLSIPGIRHSLLILIAVPLRIILSI
jgi:hypothetical protein